MQNRDVIMAEEDKEPNSLPLEGKTCGELEMVGIFVIQY